MVDGDFHGAHFFWGVVEPIGRVERPVDGLMSGRERIDDQLLVLRCQQGDPAAFDRLVGRWQERLWRHAWRLTEDETAAWDVLQEAWIAIARGLRRLEDEAAFPAWAYRIVSHKCRDWVRREARRRRTDRTYTERAQAAGEEAGQRQQRCAGLKEAVAQLPHRDRAILSLRYQEQFDTAEIAGILGVPEGTVKSRLHYARKRLRQYLEENDDE